MKELCYLLIGSTKELNKNIQKGKKELIEKIQKYNKNIMKDKIEITENIIPNRLIQLIKQSIKYQIIKNNSNNKEINSRISTLFKDIESLVIPNKLKLSFNKDHKNNIKCIEYLGIKIFKKGIKIFDKKKY
jgi:hypothetical protein